MAFEICRFSKKESCPFCGSNSSGIQFCGIAHGTNRIDEMKGCPQVKVEKKVRGKKEKK